jgi:hypothetical protein
LDIHHNATSDAGAEPDLVLAGVSLGSR